LIGAELFQAKTVVLVVVGAHVLREVSLVLSNIPIAIEYLVCNELILFCLLAFVNFGFFGHI
jgi:hypothetical protein